MQIHYNILGYRNDLIFHGYKLAIEIVENGHSDRNINYKIKRQKALEPKLDCKFSRIDPGKKNFLELSMKYSGILNNQLKKR